MNFNLGFGGMGINQIGINQMGMGMNQNMGMRIGLQSMGMINQPIFQQVSVGIGINQTEYNTIVTACKEAYMLRQTPMSQVAAQLIKKYLGGEWFVIISSTMRKTYDFTVTSVEGGDFMAFSLDSTLFQVVKTKAQKFGFGGGFIY